MTGELGGRRAVLAGDGRALANAIAERLAADGATLAAGGQGRVDILVVRAPAIPNGGFVGRDRERWWSEVAGSLTETFAAVRGVVPGMKRAGRGRIVLVPGDRAVPPATASAAAEAGLIAFAKTLGRELAPAGIGVNVVLPVGEPAAVAATVSFLASERAGAFVGQVLAARQ